MNFKEQLNLESTIFHYTSSYVGLEYILNSGLLRLSKLQNTNDPLEYKNLFIIATFWGDMTDDLKSRLYKATKDFDLTRRTQYHVVSFTQNNDDSNSLQSDSPDNLGCSRSRMWSQYGDSHKGIALVFNKNKLIKSIDLVNREYYHVFHDTVNYNLFNHDGSVSIEGNKLFEQGFDNYKSSFFKSKFKELFFTKNPDYRDEKEFRIILMPKESDEVFIPIKDSIIGLIIGDRFPNGLLPSLKFFSEKIGFPCKRLLWEKGKPVIVTCGPKLESLCNWDEFEIYDP